MGGVNSRELELDKLLCFLRCPSCWSTLECAGNGVSCLSCGQHFPVEDGVLRFVKAQGYARNFGFEWKKYCRTQLDHEQSHLSEETFSKKTGFKPEDLNGKMVLDVGCGMGRFAEVASRWGAQVVGVDLSAAAEVAAGNLAERKSVTILQANLLSLPFAPESFDFIYSIGVLHHTPDCEKAFKGLVPFLKPGGRIGIWLYSSYNKWYRMTDLYRKVTCNLPDRMLHAMCLSAVPLYHVHRFLRRVPLAGRYASGLIAFFFWTALHDDKDMRVLDTFDWYSPKYQSKHTYEEVYRWFEDCGLDSIRVLYQPVAVQGRKPESPTKMQPVETERAGYLVEHLPEPISTRS